MTILFRLSSLIVALTVSTAAFANLPAEKQATKSLSFYDGIAPVRVSPSIPPERTESSVDPLSRQTVDRRTIVLANATTSTKPGIRGTFQVDRPEPPPPAPPPEPVSASSPVQPSAAAPASIPTPPVQKATTAPVAIPAPAVTTPIPPVFSAPAPAIQPTPVAPAAKVDTAVRPAPAITAPLPARISKQVAANEVPAAPQKVQVPSARTAPPAPTSLSQYASQSSPLTEAAWPANVPKPGNNWISPEAARLATLPPQVRMPLPGIGTLPGAKRLSPSAIRVQENTLEEVMVSSVYPNRIATPFPNPRVIDSSSADITKEGSSVFIKLAGNVPTAIYITGDRPNDPVIALLLKPADLPPQVIVLALDERLQSVKGTEDSGATAPSTYTAQLTEVLKSIAIGKAPAGFSGGEIPMSTGRMGNLALRTEMRYSGRDMEVFTYWVTNITQQPLYLDESMFYVQGVRAVAFFPETQLAPNQSTRVLVVSDTKTEGQ